VLILIAFVIAIVIKTFFVQAFFIPSGSMIPTLHVGDRVLVEKVSYRFGGPARGQVVVFEKSVFGETPELPWYDDARNFVRELLGLPTGIEEDYIKRVVAIGGDTIRYYGEPRRLFVNGTEMPQDYVNRGRDNASPTITPQDCKRLSMQIDGGGCVVPAGMVFVMGDNRSNSEDSRILGPIDEDKIVGHAFMIIWPPKDFGTL
jgi:signal peptidase I